MTSAAQLTIDGAEVPHEQVVKGPSDSRVLRRPPEDVLNSIVHSDDPDLVTWADRLTEVLDRAGIAPGDAFYVSRLPKLPPAPPEPERKRSKCPQVLPRSTSQRGRVLGRLIGAHPAAVKRADLIEWCLVEGLPLASANRRLQELTEAGFVTTTWQFGAGDDEQWLALTQRALDLIDEEAEGTS